MQREQWGSPGEEEEEEEKKWRLTWRSSVLAGAEAAGYMMLDGGSVPSLFCFFLCSFFSPLLSPVSPFLLLLLVVVMSLLMVV
jgi:hypothetical protein